MNWLQQLKDLINRLGKKPPIEPKPPPTPEPKPDPTLDARMYELFLELNRQRSLKNLLLYSASLFLTTAAQKQAGYLAKNHIDLRTTNGHLGEGGSTFDKRIIAEGYPGFPVSEIVAGNFPTVQSVVNDGWMKSPGHARAILDTNSDQCGLGMAESSLGEKYWCVTFGNSNQKLSALFFDLPPYLPESLIPNLSQI